MLYIIYFITIFCMERTQFNGHGHEWARHTFTNVLVMLNCNSLVERRCMGCFFHSGWTSMCNWFEKSRKRRACVGRDIEASHRVLSVLWLISPRATEKEGRKRKQGRGGDEERKECIIVRQWMQADVWRREQKHDEGSCNESWYNEHVDGRRKDIVVHAIVHGRLF